MSAAGAGRNEGEAMTTKKTTLGDAGAQFMDLALAGRRTAPGPSGS